MNFRGLAEWIAENRPWLVLVAVAIVAVTAFAIAFYQQRQAAIDDCLAAGLPTSTCVRLR